MECVNVTSHRQTRLAPGSVDNIRHALDWAGLHYDYGRHDYMVVITSLTFSSGPGLGGPHGPYFQVS